MAHISLKSPDSTVFGIGVSSQLALAALGRLMHLQSLLGRWRQRALDRQHLSELDDRVLADMGLTRTDVDREAVKPFWQPLFTRS